MAQQHINVGASPNDGTGDTLRVSQIKAESNFTELYANKVDKAGAKVLTDVNFSAADKTKLDGLTEGGQVQSDWDQGDNLQPDYINNKPENVSDFFNDAEYIQDVGAAGGFLRSAGEWISPLEVFTPKIMDGFSGVTVGFAVGQQDYELPEGAKCIGVYLSHTKQYLTTLNNTSLVNRWSQTGDIVTITKTPVLNNYIYIEYLL